MHLRSNQTIPSLKKRAEEEGGRLTAGTRLSGAEEGKNKGRRPPWKLRLREPIFPGRTRVATRVRIKILRVNGGREDNKRKGSN
jgi:hypothetical protein